MPHRTNQDDIIFHNGSPGLKKKRRPSFWGCRPRKATSSARAHQSGRQTRAKFTEPSSSSEIISDRNSLAAARQHSNPAPSRRQRPAVGHNTMDGGIDRPVYWESPMRPQGYRSPRSPSRTRAQWPVMQPFRALIALVKRCPWAVGSDLASRDPAFSDDAYYPSVPRSLLHDTAVSFVVKDHTQSDLPEFVVSCPFEHVDKVHQLLAPDGSHRQLNARGTSGQPRAGDQLRSMLLDGTPSIELTLHPDTGRGVGGRSDNQTRPASDPWNDGAATGPTPNYGGRGWESGDPQT
ncbi:hypothetical protein Daus18300_011767 [Diaporthe australafricana]|uniref:Uncharacterized protein n=1 Tax=Diaporthe australafricana TaxID=127596 RepID=A0ABR3W5D5_9PEZI